MKLYKIKIKDPTREGMILTFTCQEYTIEENTISFIDKLEKKQVWHIDRLINIEEVKP